MLELGEAHAAAGDLPAARSAYEAVVRLARQHGWRDRLAQAALGVGSGPGGFEVPPFDREQISVLEEAASLAEGSLRATVLARLSVALSLEASAERRAALSQEAAAVARASSDPFAFGYALASWCDVIAGPADIERRLDATSQILACASRAHDTRLELLGRRFRVVALLEAGAIDEVDVEIAAFADRAGRLDQVVYSWYVPLWRAMRAAMQGQLASADRWRREAAQLGARAHSDNAAMLTESQRAMVGCEIRDAADAVAFFEDVNARWPGYALMARPALAYAYASGGDADRAEALLGVVNVADYTVDAVGSELMPSLVMLALAAWLASAPALAEELYQVRLPFRRRHAVDGIGGYHVGSLERPLGLLAALRGEPASAAAHFDAAFHEHRGIGAHLLVAGTLRDAGQALGDGALLAAAKAEYTTLGLTGGLDTLSEEERGRHSGSNVFHRDGDGWMIGLAGTTVRMHHTKGMGDLARLLANPRTDVHVLDLVVDGPTVAEDGVGESIDAEARRKYRARLLEIEASLAEADDHADVARSERLHAERDALVAELSSAYGLGGRARRRGDSAERARSAVTQRIRDALSRIEAAHPQLGSHLRHSIRTGTLCSYTPEQPIHWEL